MNVLQNSTLYTDYDVSFLKDTGKVEFYTITDNCYIWSCLEDYGYSRVLVCNQIFWYHFCWLCGQSCEVFISLQVIIPLLKWYQNMDYHEERLCVELGETWESSLVYQFWFGW